MTEDYQLEEAIRFAAKTIGLGPADHSSTAAIAYALLRIADALEKLASTNSKE